MTHVLARQLFFLISCPKIGRDCTGWELCSLNDGQVRILSTRFYNGPQMTHLDDMASFQKFIFSKLINPASLTPMITCKLESTIFGNLFSWIKSVAFLKKPKLEALGQFWSIEDILLKTKALATLKLIPLLSIGPILIFVSMVEIKFFFCHLR